jgi:phosphoribosylformylglycinamidine cyclo-ligase
MTELTYKKAGVDIDTADKFIGRIKPLLQKTGRPEILGKTGGFSGLFMPRLKGMKDPVLVSSTDGVGTKLMIAEILGKYDTVGIDLVAMCVNDVVVTGAEPLFFLDYIACGKLDEKQLYDIVKGISKGCVEAGCALIGGETAELPGMYEKGKLDLAGFSVGLVSRKKIIDGRLCQKGDRLIGLASNGLHSNGFSLARKVFSRDELKGKIGKELLKPTRIYVRPILRLLKKYKIKSLAHITGGGFVDNIPRVLPEDLGVAVDKSSWRIPQIFRTIQERGRIKDREMFRTFNMGIGMVMVISPRSVSGVLGLLGEMRIKAWEIGVVAANSGRVEF